MAAKLISTMTIKIYDNKNVDVTVAGIDGVTLRMVEGAQKLLFREINRQRAVARHKVARGFSPPDQPPPPEAAKPLTLAQPK